MTSTQASIKPSRRMRLTDTNVRKTLDKCLRVSQPLANHLTIDDANQTILVEGIAHSFVFDANLLASEKNHIEELLASLPTNFNQGRPFLEMYCTRTGRAWTNSPTTLEKLLALGMAIGKVSYTHPKNIWWALSGGMPYITINN